MRNFEKLITATLVALACSLFPGCNALGLDPIPACAKNGTCTPTNIGHDGTDEIRSGELDAGGTSDVSDVGDGGSDTTAPDVRTDDVIADAGDTAPDTGGDVGDGGSDTTAPDVRTDDVIVDAGDTAPEAGGDVGTDVDFPDTGIDIPTGPVTVTVLVHEDDTEWFVSQVGGNLFRVETEGSLGDRRPVGVPGEPILATPGQTLWIESGADDVFFGDCNSYVVPDDCTDCTFEAPRLMFNIERLNYVRMPGGQELDFDSQCVSDVEGSAAEIIETQLDGCRGNGQIFEIDGGWACLQPLGDLDGFDGLRGTVFDRCTTGECPDFVEGEFLLHSTDQLEVTTTSGQFQLAPR